MMVSLGVMIFTVWSMAFINMKMYRCTCAAFKFNYPISRQTYRVTGVVMHLMMMIVAVAILIVLWVGYWSPMLRLPMSLVDPEF